MSLPARGFAPNARRGPAEAGPLDAHGLYGRWLTVTVAVFATVTVVAAFVAATFAAALAAALTALAAAAFVATLTALAAAFVAAAFTATLAATTLVTDWMTASSFEDEAVRAFRNRDRDAVTTLEFIPSRAFRWWSGDAYATAHFVAMGAMWGRNHSAVTSVEHIAGWAFGTVLVEACAAATDPPHAAGPGHRATGAEHEKSDGEKCRQALPHEKSLVL